MFDGIDGANMKMKIGEGVIGKCVSKGSYRKNWAVFGGGHLYERSSSCQIEELEGAKELGNCKGNRLLELGTNREAIVWQYEAEAALMYTETSTDFPNGQSAGALKVKNGCRSRAISCSLDLPESVLANRLAYNMANGYCTRRSL